MTKRTYLKNPVSRILTLMVFLSLTYYSSKAQYCPLSLDCEDEDVITNVSFAGIDNSSDCSVDGYTDYTGSVSAAQVTAGETYTLNVTVGNNDLQDVGIWIDFNQDEYFDENEFFYIGSGNGAMSIDIQIPSDAPVGTTRFRVKTTFDEIFPDEPCEEDWTYYGEAEDYAIEVAAPVNTCDLTSDCSEGNISLFELIDPALSWPTGCDDPSGYSDYTSVLPAVEVTQNQAYTIGVQASNPDLQIGLWADFNQNGEFEASEFYFLGSDYGSAEITIPGNALPGETRVRIRAVATDDLTGADACTKYDQGETEEYLINVLQDIAGPCSIVVTATATPNPVCEGTTVQLATSGGLTYAWSGPQGYTSTLQSPALTGTKTNQSGVYIVTVTNSEGCVGTAFVNVVINPVPVTVINADKNPLCSSQSTSLHANGAGSYVWSTGATTPDLAISPTSNTTYTVTGTVGTCTSTASITVSVNASPTITINPANTEICVNDTITISANGGSFYVWGTGETTQSIKIHPREATTYTVTGTAANGCTNKATATVTVKDFEAGVTASKASICEGETVTLIATGGTAYSWTPGNLSGSTINVKPTVPTTYRVRITGANGCVKILEVFIDVHSKPIVYINDVKSTTPPPVCSGTEVDLRAGGAYSYLWTPDSIPGRIITVAPKTTTRYTVTGSNIWGCTSTASINVPVFAPTSARIESSTGKDPICKGQELTLTVVGLTKPVWWPGKQTTNSITMVPKDIVYAEVTGFDANGCEVTLVFEARTIYCKAPGLVDGANGRGKGEVNVLTVSPNPMNDVSYFRFATPTTERYQMNIMSTDGRLVQSQVIAEGTTVQTISKGNLSKGIYFYQIVSVQGEMVYTGKIAIVE